MPDLLLIAAAVVLFIVALGLMRVLWGPADVDRMMAAQLLGTGGMAVLLLVGAAEDISSTVDVALTMGLLAAFASIAFVKKGAATADAGDRNSTEPPA